MRRLLLAGAVALAVLTLAPGAAAQESYHTYQEMKEDTRALAEEHPEVAEFNVHGTSVAGLEIFHVDVAVDVRDRSDEELAELPTFYVDGGHHGNEILSMEAAYYFLEDVVEAASNDTSVLEGKRLVVTPIVNPDGRVADQRQNSNGVDLNRNYPFHWGRYGTSEVPGHPTYRGPESASEPETQVNMELMRGMNLEAHLSGHTGTYDIVLPWRESEDGPIPDWPMYRNTLSAVENETGLEYRDPSGAGEAPAWSYGNLSAFGVVIEVSEEQDAPASPEDVEERLSEPIWAHHVVWENLTRLDGTLEVEEVTSTTVTVRNVGWAPAYNVTAVEAGGEAAPGKVVPRVEAGETVVLNRTPGASTLTYEETTYPGEDRAETVRTLSVPTPEQTETGTASDDGLLGAPGPGVVAGLAAALGAAALRRKR